MRISRKALHLLFVQYIQAIGGHLALHINDVAGFDLNYVKEYGGWLIEQIACENGSVNHPFGSRRISTTELYYTLKFALTSMQYKNQKEQDV